MALIIGFFKAQGRAEQRAEDRKVADEVQGEFDRIRDEPLDRDSAIDRLRSRTKGDLPPGA